MDNTININLIRDTYYAGLVHDIGKSYILQDILNKKESLTYREFALIRRHPKLGYDSLKKYYGLENIAEYILFHHERWDGNGYPDKLSGDEIPLVCQILSVVDACDAMLNERSYSPTLSIDRVITELINGRETQFSPDIVDVFLTIIEG
ncbi:MAG: HD-GYP domain-containing protein [bacterium]